MTHSSFSLIFEDENYRQMKKREKIVYDLLTQSAEKKENFARLEEEYRSELMDIAMQVAAIENDLKIDSKKAHEELTRYTELLGVQEEKVRHLKNEVMANDLRRDIGELDESELTKRKAELKQAISKESEEVAILEDAISLLRRIRNRDSKFRTDNIYAQNMPGETDASDLHSEEETSDNIMETEQSDMAQIEDNKKDASNMERQQNQESGQDGIDTKKSHEKTDFDSDKTAIIPVELIGSNPERLLEPALQVQTQTGWDRYFLSREEINIGNIRNPESEIALYDAQVSRRHAKVIFDQVTDSWFFIDMASTNGSTLNGKKVDPHHPMKLSDADCITVGDTRIEVYIP